MPQSRVHIFMHPCLSVPLPWPVLQGSDRPPAGSEAPRTPVCSAAAGPALLLSPTGAPGRATGARRAARALPHGLARLRVELSTQKLQLQEDASGTLTRPLPTTTDVPEPAPSSHGALRRVHRPSRPFLNCSLQCRRPRRSSRPLGCSRNQASHLLLACSSRPGLGQEGLTADPGLSTAQSLTPALPQPHPGRDQQAWPGSQSPLPTVW